MKRKRMFSGLLVAMGLGAVLVVYQNCGKGFENQTELRVQSLPPPLPTPTPTPTPSPTPTPTPTPIPGQFTWQAIEKTNGPSARCQHTATAVGNQMFLFGGVSPSDAFLYNPATNSWGALSAAGAPTPRLLASAVYTGSKVIVWGGRDQVERNTGAVYDVATNTWAPMTTTGAPSARYNHAAVWTGTRMIVFGGHAGDIDDPTVLSSGGSYDPATDTWSPISATGAPVTAGPFSGVWTGSRLVVWGGSATATGAMYDPATDTWTPMSNANGPEPRNRHALFWTGSKVLVWGGVNAGGNTLLNQGYLYDPATDTWSPMAVLGAPGGALENSMAFTGSQLIVYESQLAQGGAYDVATDKWTAILTTGAPSPRSNQTTVWAGGKMIMWGGCYLNNGTVVTYDDGATATPN